MGSRSKSGVSHWHGWVQAELADTEAGVQFRFGPRIEKCRCAVTQEEAPSPSWYPWETKEQAFVAAQTYGKAFVDLLTRPKIDLASALD